MKIKKQIFGVSLLSFLMLLGSKSGLAQKTLYDNFNSTLINPDNWQGMQYYDPDIREAVRQTVPTPGISGDRRLRLFQTGYSATTDNNGGSGSALGLFFTNPNNVTAVSFSGQQGTGGWMFWKRCRSGWSIGRI